MFKMVIKQGFCQQEISRDKLMALGLVHAINYGFNEKALQQACLDLGISSATNSLISPIELVHHQMRQWNREIIDKMTFDEKFKEFKTNSKIKYLIKERLNLQAPYMTRWNEAMLLGSKYPNITSQILWQYADDSWYLAGDKSTDINQYTKRLLFLYIYISTELFMLTDKSNDFFLSWQFLDRRLLEIKDLGGCIDQSKYLFNALYNSGYYMGSMFINFPKNDQIDK